MKYFFVILMTFAALAGCEKAKTPEQEAADRRAQAFNVEMRCINYNIEKKDYSARAEEHCRELGREAASKLRNDESYWSWSTEDPEEYIEAVLEEMEAELDETAAAMGGPSELTAEIEQKFLISYYVFADPFTVNLKGSRKVMQAKIGLSTYFDKATMWVRKAGFRDILRR